MRHRLLLRVVLQDQQFKLRARVLPVVTSLVQVWPRSVK